MTQHTRSDEIDLVELAATIWNGKLFVLGSSILALAISGAYIKLSPNTFDATLYLRPIGSVAASRYQVFNNFEALEGRLTSNVIMQIFTEVLLERDVFAVAMDRFELLDRANFETDSDYQYALRRKVHAINIEPIELDISTEPSLQNGLIPGALSITATSDNLTELTIFMDEALSNATEITRQRASNIFNQVLQNYTTELEYAVSDAETAIDNAQLDYNTEVEQRLAFLKEQAQIARALDISRNTLELTDLSHGNTVLANINLKSPFYMRGYDAIETEIELLEARTDPQNFVPQMLLLQTQLREILQDDTSDRARAAFAGSPINDAQQFQAVEYDLASIDVSYHKKPKLILALSLFLGILVGVMGVLFRREKRF